MPCAGIDTEKKLDARGSPGCYVPKRYIVTLLGLFAVLIISVQRSSWSVVIVAMVNSSNHTLENSSHVLDECPKSFQTRAKITEYRVDRFNWDSREQGHLLGSYFYSYFITVCFGGYFAERFGAVRTIGLCVLFHSILDLLAPSTTTLGLDFLLGLRCLQGFLAGAVLPAVNTVVSRWSPKMERSRISTVMFTGVPTGIVVGFIFSGFISSAEYLGGWPTVFYTSGTVGICWWLIWSTCVYETPSSHPTITEEELQCFPTEDEKHQQGRMEVPWIAILSSVPFWAVLITNIGAFLCYVVLLTELPTYLSTILHFNIKTSGALSTLPYIANTVGGLMCSQIADKLRESGKLKITTIRKIFNSLSGYVLIACLVAIPFCGCRQFLIIGLITFGMFANGAKFSGFNATCVDMCPEFAGTVYGICLGIGSLAGIVGPAMVGAIVAKGNTKSNWAIAFYSAAAVNFVTTSFYLLFASAEYQQWGRTKCKANDESASNNKDIVMKVKY